MISSLKHYVKSFVLWELLLGLKLTGRHLFARKVTVQYPEEKTPQSPRFRGLHETRHDVIDELVVAADPLLPAYRCRQVQHPGAGAARHQLRGGPVMVALVEDHRDLPFAHHPDQTRQVRGSGRDARSVLHVPGR